MSDSSRKCAFVVYVIALALLSGCADGNGGEAARNLKIADDEISAGNPAAALKQMEARYAADPNDAATLVRMGRANFALNRDETAQIFFRKAIAADSSSDEARFGLIKTELKSNPEKALEDAEAFTRAKSGDAKVLTDLGAAYDLCGRSHEAQDIYRRAMNLDPTLLAPQVNLGLSLALSGDSAASLRLLSPLALSPDSTPRIRQDYAVAEVLAGQDDAARRMLAVDLPPGKVEGVLNSYRLLASRAP